MVAVLALAAALSLAASQQIDTEARLRTGRSALATRDYANAKREFNAVLAADPVNAAAHLGLGIIALIEGNAPAGLRHFSAVPGNPRALIGRLDCELRLGRKANAHNTATQLNAMLSADAAASEHAGKLLASAGEYAAATPFLRRVPGAAAANLLGMAEEKSGNPAAAVAAFAEAARLEPANEDYRIDHAAALLNAGDLEKSIVAFQSAAHQFPRSVRVKLGLGSALYLAGHHHAAAGQLLEAVRLEPAPRAFDLLGKAYEASGELKAKIRAEFGKYLASRPMDATAYAHFGMMQYASGQEAPARESLLRALELQPNLPLAHFHLGIIEQAAGNWEAALRRFERTAELDPENASVRYRLVTVYQKLGRKEMAQRALMEFRRLKSRENGIKAEP